MWFWKLCHSGQDTLQLGTLLLVSLDCYVSEPDVFPDLLLDLPLVELSEHIPRNHILLPKSHVVSFPYIFFLLKEKEESGNSSYFFGAANTYNNTETAI